MLAGFTSGTFSEKAIADIQALCERQELILDTWGFPAASGYRSLDNGEADCFVSPLHILPVNLPENLVIAALTGGEKRGFCLVCHPDALDNSQTLFLKTAVTIGVEHNLIAAQIAYYRSDIHFTIALDALELVAQWKNHQLDVVALPVFLYETMKESIGIHEFIPLHPREVVPPPGFGVTAYLTIASNTSIRKALQSIHDPGIAALTNVERKVRKLLPASPEALIGIYCEKPRAGQYQVKAFWKLPENEVPIRVSIASATTFELAAQVAHEMENQL